MGVVQDFIINIGLEALKNKFSDIVNQVKIKDELSEYLEQQKILNYNATREEEIDFGGLQEYISKNLIEEVEKRFWGDKKERGEARKRIIQDAASYASAHNAISYKRAQDIVADSIDILRKFYRGKTDASLRLLCSEMEDIVIEEHEKTNALIVKTESSILQRIDECSTLSVDRNMQRIANGDIRSVEESMTGYLNALSTKHSLYPYFGFHLTAENQIISYPLMEDARVKYPETIKIKAINVKVDGQLVTNANEDIFDRAYRHQTPIVFDVKEACQYLGNVKDPVQSRAEEMKGVTAILKPQEFPPAFPCNVMNGSETIVPYLLLRTKEILDDGTVVITNEEQENFHFKVVLRINSKEKKWSFNVTPWNASNQEYLEYKRFQKRLLQGMEITLYLLEKNVVFLKGKTDRLEDSDLDRVIEFYEKIVRIEDFFEVTISVPETVKYSEYKQIDRVSEMIKGAYVGEWNNLNFGFCMNNDTRQKIMEMSDESYRLLYPVDLQIKIFDKDLKTPILREIEGARIKELDRLKKKAEVLDDGDDIKIKYYSGNQKGKYIDRILTEEVKNEFYFASEDK